MGKIELLNQLGKKYDSIILYLKKKSQVEAMLAKGFLKVRNESTITQIWEKRGKNRIKIF